MKKYFLVLSLGFTFSMIFANQPFKVDQLIGKWVIVQEGIVQNGKEKLVDYESAGNCQQDYIQFNEKGSYEEHAFVNDNKNACQEFVNKGKFQIKDQSVFTSTNEMDKKVTVLSLTENTLKVQAEYKIGDKLIKDIYVLKRD